MALLALIFQVEKNWRYGVQFNRVVGSAMILPGLAVLLDPDLSCESTNDARLASSSTRPAAWLGSRAHRGAVQEMNQLTLHSSGTSEHREVFSPRGDTALA